MKDTLLSQEMKEFAMKVCMVLGILLIGWLLYTLQSILWLFGGAIFVSLLLSPFVSYFGKWHIHKWKTPNAVAILMAFLSVIVFIGLFIIAIIPVFIDLGNNAKLAINRGIQTVQIQAQENFPILDTLPLNLGKIMRKEFDITTLSDLVLGKKAATESISSGSIVTNLNEWQSFMKTGIGQISDLGISFASGITSTVAYIIFFILITFFTLLERKRLLKWFLRTLPKDMGNYFRHRQDAISDALHSWLKGQIKLVGLMFALNFIGLWIVALFGVPVENIFSLALIAGMMEFVPYAGPLLAWVTAFLMVLVSPESSPTSLIIISGLYILFQWIEGNIMVPMVMSKTMDLSPLYILLMTLVGASLGGMIGVLIAVPFASILHIFYTDWMHYRKQLHK